MEKSRDTDIGREGGREGRRGRRAAWASESE